MFMALMANKEYTHDYYGATFVTPDGEEKERPWGLFYGGGGRVLAANIVWTIVIIGGWWRRCARHCGLQGFVGEWQWKRTAMVHSTAKGVHARTAMSLQQSVVLHSGNCKLPSGCSA